MRVVSASDSDELRVLAKALVKSKRVAFIVGAGISTASGIPDFRSASTGLFASLKERNPDVKLASGKDLFHSNLFQREDTTRAFYMMIAELKRLADAAGPTDFHRLMKELDDANKLSQIYTQNIDALEAKTGLTYGLGEWKEVRRPVAASHNSPSKGKGKAVASPVGKKHIPSLVLVGKKRKSDEMEAGGSDKENADIDPHPVSPRRLHEPIVTLSQAARTEPVASTSKLPASPTAQHRQLQQSSSACTVMVPESPEELDANASFVPESSQGSHGDREQNDSSHTHAQEPDTTDRPKLDELEVVLESPQEDDAPKTSLARGSPIPRPMVVDPPPASKSSSPGSNSSPSTGAPEQAIRTSKTLTTPMVIPLHGTLDSMHCTKCQHSEPLAQHLTILDQGNSIFCPKCQAANASRNALGERSRGMGVMKVSVVLYGEEHAQAARVGEIAEKDLLKAARPDYLVVAGTTLKIPGVKKLVKELAKVIKPDWEIPVRDAEGNPTGAWEKVPDTSTKVIYVNNDPPAPETTWNPVFDTFVQGDLQVFANAVRQELIAAASSKALAATVAPPPLSMTANGTLTGFGFSAVKKVPITSAELMKQQHTNGKRSATAIPADKQGRIAFKSSKGKVAGKGKSISQSPPAASHLVAPPKPKEKHLPGWKGYVLVNDTEAPKATYWEASEVGGKRRRQSSHTAMSEQLVPVSKTSMMSAAPPISPTARSMPLSSAQIYSDATGSPLQETAQFLASQLPQAFQSASGPRTSDSASPAGLVERILDGAEDDLNLYCTCRQLQYGLMVACENTDCPYEWFHYRCVGLRRKRTEMGPDEVWWCTTCKPDFVYRSPRELQRAKKIKPAEPSALQSAAAMSDMQPHAVSVSSSNAPSPPSLASDVSTLSDADEIKSQKCDVSVDMVPDSQGSDNLLTSTFPLIVASKDPAGFLPASQSSELVVDDSQPAAADLSFGSELTDLDHLEEVKKPSSKPPITVADLRKSLRGRPSLDYSDM